ncbi:MAG: DUF333 domain-containing protein [Desulfamplus sp.]|nr:DUF333 domain-containing protein [Desulfamplus sp.]
MKQDYLIFLIIFISLISCNVNTAGENEKLETNKQRIANPAATRCVNDGYKLEPVIENGVTIEYICINPETGLECEVWRYFRKECQLTR